MSPDTWPWHRTQEANVRRLGFGDEEMFVWGGRYQPVRAYFHEWWPRG